MNRLLCLSLLAALAWAGCSSEEDNDCVPFSASWQTPAAERSTQWLFLSDEQGGLLQAQEVQAQNSFAISTEGCQQQLTLSYLSVGETEVLESGNPRTETVYRLTTLLEAPAGFAWDTLAQAPPARYPIAVRNVESVEQLVWPAERRDVFQGNQFLDPAANLLSFEIQAEPASAAYLRIRANGEPTERGLFFPALGSDTLTADYNTLPAVGESSPVDLPNGGNWRYELYGIEEEAEALLDYSNQPDLVSGSFAPLLPAGGTPSYRLRAEEVRFFEGIAYAPYLYDVQGNGLPERVAASEADFSLQRQEDQLQVTTKAGAPLAYCIRIRTFRGPGPWLDWTIYGQPEALADVKLPDWPDTLAAQRQVLLGTGNEKLFSVSAKSFLSQVDYQEFLQALGRKEPGWQSENGLLERTKVRQW